MYEATNDVKEKVRNLFFLELEKQKDELKTQVKINKVFFEHLSPTALDQFLIKLCGYSRDTIQEMCQDEAAFAQKIYELMNTDDEPFRKIGAAVLECSEDKESSEYKMLSALAGGDEVINAIITKAQGNKITSENVVKYRMIEEEQTRTIIFEDGGFAATSTQSEQEEGDGVRSAVSLFDGEFTQYDLDAIEWVYDCFVLESLKYSTKTFDDPSHIETILNWHDITATYVVDEDIWPDFEETQALQPVEKITSTLPSSDDVDDNTNIKL